MARKKPVQDVLRALFAKSGNQCAFPGCTHPLINEKNQLIAQVCHIEGASEGGERYDVSSNDEYRRGYKNLIILCYQHHVETSDVDEYPVACLAKMKSKHEQLFDKTPFTIDESTLLKLTFDMEKYWSKIKWLNEIDHIYADSELAMEVYVENHFFDIMSRINETIDRIQEMFEGFLRSNDLLLLDFNSLLEKKGISPNIFFDIPYYENPFVNRNWESYNIGVPNVLTRMRIDIKHLEVKYYEEYLKRNNGDLVAKIAFEKAKNSLENYAKTMMYVD